MLYFADLVLQQQPEDNLMVAIFRALYNGSYTMAAKPIKSLELHYTMIQFLKMDDMSWSLKQSLKSLELQNPTILFLITEQDSTVTDLYRKLSTKLNSCKNLQSW